MKPFEFASSLRKPHLSSLTHLEVIYLFGALSLNVAKERNQENGKNGLGLHHSRVPREALQKASPMNGGCGSIKGGSL